MGIFRRISRALGRFERTIGPVGGGAAGTVAGLDVVEAGEQEEFPPEARTDAEPEPDDSQAAE